MCMGAPKKDKIEALETDPIQGLSSEEVSERIRSKLTNKTKQVIGKSYFEIFVTNIFTFFNLLLVIIATLLIIAERYSSLIFATVYIANICIGLYQDIKAHRLLAKLKVLVEPTSIVIRDQQEQKISINEIVRDDIVILSAGNQIPADSTIVEGEVGINESLITGESNIVYKTIGERLFSGSYVVSGTVKCRVIHVGKENYATSLQATARVQKANSSQFKKSLKYLFLTIGIIIAVIAILTIGLHYDHFVNDFKNEVGTFAGSMIAMIPGGLYLLTSFSLTVGVINLSQKRTLVQEFYSLEMLARSTMLCLDKTGTITDGTMRVMTLINKSEESIQSLELLISNVILATKDKNATAQALLEAYPFEKTDKALEVIPFDSRYKFSAATFHKGTYVIGALEFLDVENKKILLKETEVYSKKGHRVLALAKATNPIKRKTIEGKMKIVALLVLEEHIREDAKEIFSWFSDNGVKIRVISGDNAKAVSEIAKRAGIKQSEKYISLGDMSLDEVRQNALKYVVFGRVSPEQKEVLIEEFKKAKEVVAMTGDGVNDILALKKSDCSIAMASGADAAKNVSQLVLLDSNFSNLPNVVAEGRRVVNNIQRTGALFLMKTIFAVFFSVLFLITYLIDGVSFPFVPNNFYLWEMSVIGLGALFLAVEENSEPIEGKFITNVFRNAVPGAIMMIIGVLFTYLFYIDDVALHEGTIISMAAIVMGILPLVLLYEVSRPLNLYRSLVLGGVSFINISALIIGFIVDRTSGKHELLQIDFSKILAHNVMQLALIIVTCAALYISATSIIRIIRGRGKKK